MRGSWIASSIDREYRKRKVMEEKLKRDEEYEVKNFSDTELDMMIDKFIEDMQKSE